MNCRHAIKALGVLVLGLALTAPAGASVLNWTAVLDQGQEVVQTQISIPSALGSAFGTLDDISGLLSWNISWSGLSGPAISMHFHAPAPAGTNAGVAVNIGSISGLLSPSIGNTSISPAQVSHFVAGLWYINIHTSQNPAGEIRGQVIVSEPATALLALGLLGAGFASRRRIR